VFAKEKGENKIVCPTDVAGFKGVFERMIGSPLIVQ
jgi:hypothetical protein